MPESVAIELPALPEFTQLINVADDRLGAKALFASDEFFAAKERILNAEPAVFIVGKYDDNGKWMDGWETRRKRQLGNDYLIIKLAKPAKIKGFDIDTSNFTGNYPPACQIEGIQLDNDADTQTAEFWNTQHWQHLTNMVSLQGNLHHYVASQNTDSVITHIRLSIYPDGGVARLRVYGEIVLDNMSINHPNSNAEIDLVSALNGGQAIAWNDAHFGQASNLLLPNKAPNMGEGWETRRRREPGNDWCILQLGRAGIINKIEIDTAFFKGNFPDKVSIQAVYAPELPKQALITQSMFWDTLLAPQPLTADSVHEFTEILLKQPITHVRVNIFPDGGISRVKLFGTIA